MGGIAIGSGASFTTIGGAAQPFQDVIRYNDGPGVIINSSRGNAVLDDQIEGSSGSGVVIEGSSAGTQVMGNAISGNASDGVTLIGARKVRIGGNSTGDVAGSDAASGAG